MAKQKEIEIGRGTGWTENAY